MARDVATFRGVAFFVETSDLTGGRKTVTHDYPRRNQSFVEDLGLRGRVFQIEGYILADPRVPGADAHLSARDAFIDALEQEGPGTLVHPYHGTRLVAIPRFTTRESRDESRVVYFSIDCEETPAEAFSPSADISRQAQVDAASDASHAASEQRFLTSYRLTFPVSGAPGLPGVGATRSLPNFTFSSLTGVVTSASRALHTALAPLARTADAASSLKRQIDSLVSDASSLVRDPLSLTTRFLTLFNELRTFPRIPSLGVRGFLAAADFTSTDPRPPASTVTRQYEQANYDELDAFLRRALVSEAARQLAAAATSFDSYESAVVAREEVLAAIDEHAELAPDDVYAVLVELRADVAAALPDEVSSLPRLVPHTPPGTVPSLVLAYRLYGSVALADDIVARNRVRHPGFVLGGRALQVITSG